MERIVIDKSIPNFHSVEFMKETREKLSEQYLSDKGKYLKNAKRAMEEFKKRLKTVNFH